MTTEATAAAPAESETPVEQVTTVESTPVESTEATTEQTQAEPVAKKEPWFQKRIGELTREKYEGRRAAEQATAEAQQLRDQLARLQAGEQPQAQPAGDVETLVQQRARELVKEQSFNDSCNKVYAQGKSDFPDFDAAVRNLQMVGGTRREFLDFVAASDAGAKVLHTLGSDLEEADRILSLPPVQMARELTKLEIKLGQPQAKPVSRVPAPITPVSSGAVSSSDVSDPSLSDAEFARRRKAQIAQRH